jgi:hypothetical protein
MTNIPNKLDQKIKESLDGYSAQYNESGWERLSKELDARGTNSSMKWKWQYSMNTIIGATVLGGVILLTTILTTSNNNISANVPYSLKEKQEGSVYKPRSAKSIFAIEHNAVTVNMLVGGSAVTSEKSPSTAPQTTVNAGAMLYAQYYGNNPITKSPLVQIKTNSSGSLINPLMRGNPFVMQGRFEDLTSNLPRMDERINGKGMKLSPEELKIFTNNQYLSNKGVIFGDQIDPRKGYIHATKETDSMQRLMQYWSKTDEETKDVRVPDSMNIVNTPENNLVPTVDPPKEENKKKSKKNKTPKEPKETKVKENNNPEPDTISTTPKEHIKRRNDKPKEDTRKDPFNPYK